MVIDGIKYVPEKTIKYIRQPKYREGQVLFWSNGRNVYVQVIEVLPLHCEGACYCYYVSTAGPMRFSTAKREGPISEEVLRALVGKEIGLCE